MTEDHRETFEAFMARALYDPHTGYYSRNLRGIGQRGDFTTFPQRSDLLARAISSWAAAALAEHRCRHLIEIGPGLGTLASAVLANLPLIHRLRIRLHLVETSPRLTAIQKKSLGHRAVFHSSMESAISACNGKAVIYSNELVDAFPVRVFTKHQNSWREISITRTINGPVETSIPADPLPPSSIFLRPFQTGQRVEVHDSYRKWLARWLPSWKKGEMLTIDYGASSDKLYHRQPSGSLRAYLLHQPLVGNRILENAGLQDITADVNFTDLLNWSAPRLASDPILNLNTFLRQHAATRDHDLVESAEYFQVLRQRTHSP